MKFTRTLFYHGDVRTITYFAWFPVSVTKDKVKSTRWLENITVKEVRQCHGGGHYWYTMEFLD